LDLRTELVQHLTGFVGNAFDFLIGKASGTGQFTFDNILGHGDIPFGDLGVSGDTGNFSLISPLRVGVKAEAFIDKPRIALKLRLMP
jgi:hypothetical protein